MKLLFGKRNTLLNRMLLLTLIFMLSLSLFDLPFVNSPQKAEAKKITMECTNSESDAAMINSAIQGSQQGDEIVFQGNCLINQTIKLLSHRTYRGGSRTGTVLKQADNANLDAVVASASYLDNRTNADTGITMRSFSIEGNNKNNTKSKTAGIAMRSWQSTITDMQIRNNGGSGIKLTNLSADGTPTSKHYNGQWVHYGQLY